MQKSRENRTQPFTVTEAAGELGVSPMHIYRLCARGALKHSRLGRKILIPAPVLFALLGGNQGGRR